MEKMSILGKLFGMKKSKKKQDRDITRMPRKEKEHFLSMDLIERMIRVEQRVSTSFKQKVAYNHTEYYKSLSASEKKDFEKYLREKNRRRFLLGLLAIVPLLAFVSMKIEITGNAIRNTITNESAYTLVQNISMWAALGLFSLFLLGLIFKKIKGRRYESHFKVLENAFLAKNTVRHLKSKKSL